MTQKQKRIRKLEKETVERIAAGEVVENPASVVKELVENSIDAGATSVDVEVENGGLDTIRVSDDGVGMSREDALLSFERHATSKIDGTDDIDSVETLGFRGEALPSIARVSEVEMVTKPSDSDGVGATRVVTGPSHDEPETERAGRGVGTTVEVSEIFADTPARRKSLGTPNQEFSEISDVVTHYALVHPEVGFDLEHDGRTVLSTPGSDDYVDPLFGAYGREVANRGVRFEDTDQGVEARGVAVRPGVTRSSPEHVYVSVNGRALDDETVRQGVLDGYGTLLPEDRYPIAVVDVSLPFEWVDVNVHPSKREVKFHDEERVRQAVESGVRGALSTEELSRKDEMEFGVPVENGDTEGEPPDSAFDGIEVIGQFRDLYLLCEKEDDLLVVDQHAAHERINYESLTEEFGGPIESVELGSPESVDLTPEEVSVLEANRDALEHLGFVVEEFGGGMYRVREIPAPLGRIEDVDKVHDILDDFLEGREPDNVRDEMLKEVACHPSLKAGDSLEKEEATELVRELGSCGQPFSCPHGRPTVLSLNEKKLAEGFERDSVRLG